MPTPRNSRSYHRQLITSTMHGQATTLINHDHDYSYDKSDRRHRALVEANLPSELEEARWVEQDQARLRQLRQQQQSA